MSYLQIKKRCIRCRQYLREDGTCGNEKCSRYTPPKSENKADDKVAADDIKITD